MSDQKTVTFAVDGDYLTAEIDRLGVAVVKRIFVHAKREGIRLPLKIIRRERVAAASADTPDRIVLYLQFSGIEEFLAATNRADDLEHHHQASPPSF